MNDAPPIQFVPTPPDFAKRFPAIDQALEILLQMPEGSERRDFACKIAEQWLILATPAPLLMVDAERLKLQGDWLK